MGRISTPPAPTGDCGWRRRRRSNSRPLRAGTVLGVATYALELFRASRAPLDALYVAIGLGCGICGCIMARRDLLGLPTEIIGVQSTEAAAYALSFPAGRLVTTETADTRADGMATRIPDPAALDMIRAAARIVTVYRFRGGRRHPRDSEDTHNLAEGAGGNARGPLQERARTARRHVATILCGGNIDLALFWNGCAGHATFPG